MGQRSNDRSNDADMKDALTMHRIEEFVSGMVLNRQRRYALLMDARIK